MTHEKTQRDNKNYSGRVKSLRAEGEKGKGLKFLVSASTGKSSPIVFLSFALVCCYT